MAAGVEVPVLMVTTVDAAGVVEAAAVVAVEALPRASSSTTPYSWSAICKAHTRGSAGAAFNPLASCSRYSNACDGQLEGYQ